MDDDTRISRDQLIEGVYANTELRALTQRMRTFLRGCNAGELIGFDQSGQVISCRLTGTTIHGAPVSTPQALEYVAAYLLFGATSQDDVAAAVAAKRLWQQFADAAALAVDISPGDTVRGTPVGQTRRQLIEVDRVDGDYIVGHLLSRKYPGNYRGTAVAAVDDCVIVQRTTH